MTIPPISSDISVAAITGAGRVSTTAAATAPSAGSGVSTGADSVTVDTIPASPPADVLSEMGTAAQAQDRLAASDRALHFAVDPPTGRVTAQLSDLTGNALGTVALSTVLDVAAGATLN